jgi:hypothetical protein
MVAVSRQRHHSLDSTCATGILSRRNASPSRFASARPVAFRLRSVLQSPSLNPGGSPTPGSVSA